MAKYILAYPDPKAAVTQLIVDTDKASWDIQSGRPEALLASLREIKPGAYGLSRLLVNGMDMTESILGKDIPLSHCLTSPDAPGLKANLARRFDSLEEKTAVLLGGKLSPGKEEKASWRQFLFPREKWQEKLYCLKYMDRMRGFRSRLAHARTDDEIGNIRGEVEEYHGRIFLWVKKRELEKSREQGREQTAAETLSKGKSR